MKCAAVIAALVAVAAAQQHPAATPVVKLNPDQEAALASLSSAQSKLNMENSQMIAHEQASQEAALHSISQAAHGQQSGTGLDNEASDSDSNDLDSLDEHSGSGAASITGSVLALIAVLGAAMF
ncbi:hypothetical protein H4R19_002784 [Coemansia spiralis]|nr:hypothetical protein H4R19_002784 [Coemansia spiralis]